MTTMAAAASTRGLTSAAAAQRLQESGPNALGWAVASTAVPVVILADAAHKRAKAASKGRHD